MITSTHSKDVFWLPPGTKIDNHRMVQHHSPHSSGGWYFWDEIGLFGGGPYTTEAEALHMLAEYVKTL